MKVSSVLYLIAALAFFMPFFVVSCQQTELIKIDGIKLVTGGEIKLPLNDVLRESIDKDTPPAEDKKIKPQPLAIAAFAIAILAIILVLVLPRSLYLIPALFSLAGIICLQLLKSGMLDAMSLDNSGLSPSIDLAKVLSLKAKFGFWLSNISFFLGGVVVVVAGMLGRSEGFQPTQPSTGFEHLRPVPPLEPVHTPTQTEPEVAEIVEPDPPEPVEEPQQ